MKKGTSIMKHRDYIRLLMAILEVNFVYKDLEDQEDDYRHYHIPYAWINNGSESYPSVSYDFKTFYELSEDDLDYYFDTDWNWMFKLICKIEEVHNVKFNIISDGSFIKILSTNKKFTVEHNPKLKFIENIYNLCYKFLTEQNITIELKSRNDIETTYKNK